jgi:hypothetical protein
MKDLGMMHYFLGLEFWWRLDGIFLNQGKYVVEILKRFKMLDCNSMVTLMVSNFKLLQDTTSEIMDSTLYRNIVGSLMHLTNIRPNICFVVNTLSQYLEHPRQVHLVATKYVLGYLKGTLDHGLWYRSDHEVGLYGYSYSYWVGSIPDQKRNYGYCFKLGSSMFLWSSRNQSCVGLSTTKVEYVAACATRREEI